MASRGFGDAGLADRTMNGALQNRLMKMMAPRIDMGAGVYVPCSRPYKARDHEPYTRRHA